jgi:hypothetical protein
LAVEIRLSILHSAVSGQAAREVWGYALRPSVR